MALTPSTASTSSSIENISHREIEIVSDYSGLTLAAKFWTTRTPQKEGEELRPIEDPSDEKDSTQRSVQKVITLHGWLDNAASWDDIASRLISKVLHRKRQAALQTRSEGDEDEDEDEGLDLFQDMDIVCLDLPGHGRSQLRPLGTTYDTGAYVADVYSVLDKLKWTKDVILMGHSMGAAISTVVASLDHQTTPHPDRLKALITVEGFGVWSAQPDSAPKIMLDAINSHRALTGRKPNFYPNILTAARKLMENNKDLSEPSALKLVSRSTIPYHDPSSSFPSSSSSLEDQPVVFRHDVKLRAGGFFRFTEEQALAFVTSILCPTLVILGEKGNEQLLTHFPPRKEAILKAGNIQRILEVRIPEAGHHLHMEQPEEVFPHIWNFIRNPTGQHHTKKEKPHLGNSHHPGAS